MTAADPIAGHLAELERALHGPRRLRRSMLDEVRDGLLDTSSAYEDAGLDPRGAAERAVHDFGSPRELAPQFQEELTARQGRWMAVLVAIVFPGMTLGWTLLWSTGVADRGPASPLVIALSTAQDGVAALVAAAAVALLAATFHRTASPRRITTLIGVIGATGGLACGVMAVLMNLTSVPVAAGERLDARSVELAAFVVSGAVLLLIVWAAVRTLRVVRSARVDLPASRTALIRLP